MAIQLNEAFVDAWIAAHEREMVKELMEWTAIPSVSRADLCDEANKAPYGPDVRKMLDHALARAAELGFRTEDHDGYCGSAWYGDAEEELGFVAHLDVVPEGQGWIYSPYEPVEKDGFIIGRGCNDNKAAGVVGLFIMRFLKENGITLNRSFRLMMGCAEETGMADFRTYQERGGKVPSFGIVADGGFPTCYAEKGGWNADILIPAGADVVDFKAGNVRNAIPDLAVLTLRGGKGVDFAALLADRPDFEVKTVDGTEKMVKITAHGKGGHAAGPAGTDNAITKLCEAVCEVCPADAYDLAPLEFIAKTFRMTDGSGMGFACTDDITGPLTSNIGVISVNNGKLKALLDIRYPVKCDIDALTESFRALTEKAGVEIVDLDIEKAFYLPKDDPRILMLQEVYATVTGDTEAEPYTMGGGTYSRVIPNAITFGPGLPGARRPEFLPEGHGSCHGPDEVQDIEAWMKGFKIYIMSVLKLGGAM